MLLSWDLTLRLPLLVLPGLLALCGLLSPLLRGTVRRTLSLRLLALLRSRRNNTLTAEAHALLLLLLGRKWLSPLLARCLLLTGNGSVSLLSPLLRCGLLLLLWLLSPLLRGCKRSTLRCLGLSPLLRCGLLLLLLGRNRLSPLLRGRLGRGGLGWLRLRPLLLRALLRLRLRSRCRSSWRRSSWRRGRGRCSRWRFHVGLCLHGFSCRLYGRHRLVRGLSFRLGNRRMTGRRRGCLWCWRNMHCRCWGLFLRCSSLRRYRLRLRCRCLSLRLCSLLLSSRNGSLGSRGCGLSRGLESSGSGTLGSCA